MDWTPPDADFGFLADGPTLETRDLPEGRTFFRKALKREFLKAGRLKDVALILPSIPEPGTSVHIIGNGKYDFFDWLPHLLGLLPEPAEGWLSTWTMNRGNAVDLLQILDAGQLTAVTMLTGLYFKRREAAVYATLYEGLQQRGQRYLAFLNHTKLILLRSGRHALTVEGSANFTSNPRLEQYVISNDRELLAFHVDWIDALDWGDGQAT